MTMDFTLFGQLAAILVDITNRLLSSDRGDEDRRNGIHGLNCLISRLPDKQEAKGTTREDVVEAMRIVLSAIRAGEVSIPLPTVLRRAEFYRSTLMSPTFTNGQEIRVRDLPPVARGGKWDYHLMLEPRVRVWKVETIDPDMAKEQILHHQRIAVTNEIDGVRKIFGSTWLTEKEFRATWGDEVPDLSWISGHWFEPVEAE